MDDGLASKGLAKVCFFSWEAAWYHNLMIDNLKHRDKILINQCLSGKLDGKSVNHFVFLLLYVTGFQ